MKFNFFKRNSLNIKKILSPRTRKKITWKKVGRGLLWAGGAFLLLIAIMFAIYSKDLPTPAKIAARTAAQSTKIYDRTGETLLYETGEEKRTIIESNQIPENLKNATVAVEDENFYKHSGFDMKGLAAAVWEKITDRRTTTRGASTITQQYIKNALLDSNRTMTRKIKELILSIELEFMYDKDEILTMYLNEIPYGGNTAGAEAAARMYYGIPASELSLSQAATLAAIPQAPTYYSPYGTHTDNLGYRKNYVLKRMVEQGFITQEEADTAEEEDTITVGSAVQQRKDTILAPHFALYVIEQAAEEFGEEKIQKEGLKIITTLDFEKQKIAEEAINNGVPKIERYGAENAALVSIDPNNGQVLAMVGSKDFFNTEIDGNVNVTASLRQPGSSFKPYSYATLLKKKEYAPASILFDLQTDFGGGYVPRNYDGYFEGPVTIRHALANSLNIPAVKSMSLAGLDNVIRTAEDMGISTLTDRDRYGLSLVLGSGEVKPLEMAGAYGVFANQGVKHDIKTIMKVYDQTNKILYEYQPEKDTGRKALDPQIAYEITDILSDNVARAPHMGYHSQLNFPGKNIASKTGTTSSYKDAWTVGYSRNVVTAVWVGNNDSREMKAGAAGLVIAAPIYHEYMDNVVNPDDKFEQPDGIQTVTVDKLSTKLPTEHSPETITDIFASWQVPTEQDNIHVKVKILKGTDLLAPDDVPDSLVEERLYTNIHSERPDYPNWEGPVRAWAESLGFGATPPTEYGDPGNLAPTISVSSPSDGSTVTGTQTINVNASSNIGVKNVTFYIDDISIGVDSNSPYAYVYNFNDLTSGNHKITAIVTDTNNATAKASVNITVQKDEDAPIISAVTEVMISPTSYKITWTTDEKSTSQVIYGLVSDTLAPYTYTNTSTKDTDLVTSHSVTITVLTGQTYYYRVISIDSSKNSTTSNQYNFSS